MDWTTAFFGVFVVVALWAIYQKVASIESMLRNRKSESIQHK